MAITQNFPNTRPSLNLNFARSQTLDSRITFVRPSGTGDTTYADSNGLVVTATADEPRFDYDPGTGESLGLLIEQGSSNLITYSEEFDNVAWNTSPLYAVGVGSTTAPDGNVTAEKLIRNSTNTQSQINRNITGISTNSPYTLSCFAKSGEWSKIGLREGLGEGYWSTFDLSDGTTIDTSAGVTPTITPYPNGWYRISMLLTTTATQTSYGVRIIPLPDSYTSGTPYYEFAGNGSDGLYLWGAQLELGGTMTSYIPTTNSTATRVKDVATIDGTNFSDFYNPTEGTIYVKYNINGHFNIDGFNRVVEISDEGNQSRLSSPLLFGKNQQVYEGLIANNQQIDFNTCDITFGDFYKYICAFKQDDFQRYAIDKNGIIDSNSDSIDQSFDLNSFNPTELNIGHEAASDSRQLNGHIKQLIYYPSRLSNEQLQTLLLQ